MSLYYNSIILLLLPLLLLLKLVFARSRDTNMIVFTRESRIKHSVRDLRSGRSSFSPSHNYSDSDSMRDRSPDTGKRRRDVCIMPIIIILYTHQNELKFLREFCFFSLCSLTRHGLLPPPL